MIFNLLDKFEEQFCTWYYLEFDIKTPDKRVEFVLPIICAARDENYVANLQFQILRDLSRNFICTPKEAIELNISEKILKEKELNLKYKNEAFFPLQFIIKKATEVRPVGQIPTNEYVVGNLDYNTTYINDKHLEFNVTIIKGSKDYFSNMNDWLTIRIDKDKLSKNK